jgi:hypothetical protein
MDSTHTIIALVVASTALFLGFMGWKLVWFLRKIRELPRDAGHDATTERIAKDKTMGVSDADGGSDA